MSLRVWLPLDGDLHNQGCTNITVINSGATVNTNGKIGNCYYFNASSYLYENTYNWTNFNTSQFSLCCWYKQPSPVASGNSQMICIGTSSGWNNIRIGLLRRTSNGYPMFSVSNGSSAVSYNCTATTFSLDTWNHIACTYDNGTIKIYLNGTLNKTYTTTIVPVLNSSQHLGIGAASNGAEKLTGYLNDVRIYDHALSAAEVKKISQGLVLHYKLDNITNGIADSSGYGHNGKILKGPLTIINDQDRYSQGIKFTATNKKIEISNLITSGFGNSYSFAWWAKVNSLSPMHWGFADGIRLNGMYTGRLWNTGDSSSNPLYNPGTTTQVSAPSINTWHYWVMTGNGTKCYVYQDGVLWGEAKTYKAISGSTIYINGWNTSTNYSSNDLSISDFRIYCTALSPDDVLELYHTSAKIDNKQNLHTFELVEDSSKISINNKGQTLCDELIEDTTTKFYKGTKIIKTNQLIEI